MAATAWYSQSQHSYLTSSEFMPIGLLTDIADSFHITEHMRGTDYSIFMDRYVTVSAVDASIE